MNEVLEEWVGKAEGDFRTAEREFSVTQDPNYDAVCFHAQQCIEKLMKAVLLHRSIAPPRIHDLFQLHQLLQPIYPAWSPAVEDLRYLSRAAVEFRYPGELADREEAEEAMAVCRRLRSALLPLLAQSK
jgi:HEPN domain-containing protein